MTAWKIVCALRKAQSRSGRMLFVRGDKLYGEQNYDCEISWQRWLLRELVRRYGAVDAYRLLSAC